MTLVRITEQRAQVVEVSYDVEVPGVVDDEDELFERADECFYEGDAREVHRQTLRSNSEIVSREVVST